MKEEVKKTKILVLSDHSLAGKAAREHGQLIAQLFQSEMEVITMTKQILPEQLYIYAEAQNVILFVIGISAPKKRGEIKGRVQSYFTVRKGISFIRPSRIPVLVVGEALPLPTGYQKVILPVDVDRQTKEKAMWASYFVRFYKKQNIKAEVQVIHNQYKEEVTRRKVENNLSFIEKLFNNLEVDYTIIPQQVSMHIDQESVSYVQQEGAGVTLIMMTRFYSLIDLLFGSKESRIIGNSEGVPVLCLNERDDLFVLCQ